MNLLDIVLIKKEIKYYSKNTMVKVKKRNENSEGLEIK